MSTALGVTCRPREVPRHQTFVSLADARAAGYSDLCTCTSDTTVHTVAHLCKTCFVPHAKLGGHVGAGKGAGHLQPPDVISRSRRHTQYFLSFSHSFLLSLRESSLSIYIYRSFSLLSSPSASFPPVHVSIFVSRRID